MKLLILDNYDSFTYNLVQLVKENSDYEVEVFRNDEISLDRVANYHKIMLSPGPGIPSESGILCGLIERYKTSRAIFGVCLGMQAIAEVFGARLYNVKEPFHGVATLIHHYQTQLFTGIPEKFKAGRYHSWAVEASSIPKELKITAVDEQNIVMAIEHEKFQVSGVQFHPESMLTEYGIELIINFLKEVK